MNILHYFLGFPPYRTGGLTKYAFELMKAQVSDGNEIIALWPGEIRKLGGKPSIKHRKSINGIGNYELINPLPVALDEGINDIDAYTKPCDINVYKKFLETVNPDAIHVHTLMGMHREFISVANKLNIRTIFTTHDYFGICPKVTLYRYGSVCENDHGCRDCIQCNCMSLSLKKIQIMQSPIYRIIKNTRVIKRIRKQHRGDFFANEKLPEMPSVDIVKYSESYKALRRYYVGMLENIELIHFNSSVTECVFKKYFTPKNSKVMTIMHQSISDNRKKNKWIPRDKLRIAFLAPAKPFKGFNILKQALDEIWNSGNHSFELKLFSPVRDSSPYMVVREDGYEYGELCNILAEADVLVAPSVWYETFGFTVLEAISYGVPVIVSDHVGAQDIVGKGGIVIKADSADELREAILRLTTDIQSQFRKKILECSEIKTWDTFMKENYLLYE